MDIDTVKGGGRGVRVPLRDVNNYEDFVPHSEQTRNYRPLHTEN